jgi:hypothetical protein
MKIKKSFVLLLMVSAFFACEREEIEINDSQNSSNSESNLESYSNNSYSKSNSKHQKTIHEWIDISTGLDIPFPGGAGNNVYQSPGNDDNHWDVSTNGAPFVDAKVSTGLTEWGNGTVDSPYMQSNVGVGTTARWLAPVLNSNNNIPIISAANYTYRRRFFIDCPDFTYVGISFWEIMGDDQILDIRVNGTTISPMPSPPIVYTLNYMQRQLFGNITSLCKKGTNTFDFVVSQTLNFHSFYLVGGIGIDYEESCDEGELVPIGM